MYPASFEYHRATSVPHALELLATFGDDAKVLAGGHSLLPVMKLRFATPAHLIDLGRVPGLSGITEAGGVVTIGAMTRHADVATSAVVRAKAPLLAEVAGHIGDQMIRNMGTIGGSLAHADPAADLPAAMLALGASLVLQGKNGSRTVGADPFFVDTFQTALAPGELLVAVQVPVSSAACAYAKHADPASGYAIAGVAIQLGASGGRVALTGLAPRPMRLAAVEAALAAGAGAAAADRAADGVEFIEDARGSVAYKANLAKVFTQRALAAAIGRK